MKNEVIFTVRAYARAVLGVIILSVCASVYLSHVWIVTNLNGALQIYCTRNGNHCYSDTNSGLWATLPSFWNLCSEWPTPFEKRWLQQIFAYNVSTVRDSEKSSIMTNIKSTTRFPMSYRWSAYVTPKSSKGGSKSDFFVVLNKSQLKSHTNNYINVRSKADK